MIPPYVQPFLWSYDISKLDISRDKRRIITNVLNLGSSEATKWLFKTYSRRDLKNTITHPLCGEWSRKSLNYWSLVFDAKPELIGKRFLQ